MSRAELPLHRRTITVTAHQEPGGEEISVEAELRDERPWAEPAAADIHRMVLAVRVRLADMTIVAADADMLTFPHAECPFITPVFDSLIGLGVAAGYNRAIQERFRGVLGCSHLYELARVLGPAVVQAAMSANARRRDAGEVANGPRSTAGVLNSCHIWAPDGVGLRKLDAGRGSGRARYPDSRRSRRASESAGLRVGCVKAGPGWSRLTARTRNRPRPALLGADLHGSSR